MVTGDNCSSHFPPLCITEAEKLHFLPGRLIVCRSHYVHNGIETDTIPRNRQYRYMPIHSISSTLTGSKTCEIQAGWNNMCTRIL